MKSNYLLALGNIRFRWKTYYLYSVLSICAFPTRLDLNNSKINTVILSLLAGFFLTFAIAPLLWVGFQLIQKLRSKKIGLAFPFLLIAIFGAIRGYLMPFALQIFGIENRFSTISSIGSSMFFTLISFAGTSLVIELISKPAENYRSEFSKASMARLNRTGESGLNLTESEYLQSMRKIESAIDKHLPGDESLEPSQKEILAAAQEIQNQIEEVLRPFSHRLWVGVFGEVKTVSGRKLILEALCKPKFSIILLLCFQFIVGSFGIALGRSIPDSLVLSSFGSLTTAIVLFGFRILYGKRDSVSIFIGSSFLLILGVVPVLIGSLSRPAGSGILAIASGLFIAPAMPLLVFIASLYSLIIIDKEFAVTAAKAVRIQQTMFDDTRESNQSDLELAGYLHNSLQSQLLRISKQLEQSSIKESGNDSFVHFKELSQILGRTMDDLTLLKREGMGRLTSIIDAWKGIADIYYDAPESLKISVEGENLLIEIIEEFITNSIRHGEASKIAISVKQDNEALEVEIAHNGKLMTILGNGFGIKWLANYSLNEPVFNAERNSLTYMFSIK